jgi:DNA/RNA-binding domain of Phe-tRNA-synthetase-like protein
MVYLVDQITTDATLKLRFVISDEVAKSYPSLRVGIVVAKIAANTQGNDELEAVKRSVETKIRDNYSSQTLVNHPYVAAWRETYRSIGVKAKKYNPTCEALIRRILDGEPIPRINAVVDTYLAVEGETFLPCGGYDLDRIEGDITLRYSPGNESFVPLGGGIQEETNSGEVVYADSKTILTRKWNFRDGDSTKITLASKNIALFSEAALPQIPTNAVSAFIERLKSLLQKFCGGEIRVFIASADGGTLAWEM